MTHRLVARVRLGLVAPLLLSAALLGSTPSAPVAAQEPHGASARDPHVLEVQEGIDFRVYARDGRRASLDAVLDAARDAEVLLVGEEHDDRVGQAVELRLLTGLYGRLAAADGAMGRPLVLSLEMFERDVQYILDEYLAGLISESHFLGSARPWAGYQTAYRPLVEFAKGHGVTVVAANAPRRYVNRVTAEGPASLLALSSTARSYLPPLPYPGPSERYRAEWERVMAESADSSGAHGHELGANALHAQALWDASMGHAIVEALLRSLDAIVVHVAGSFHVARGTGIPERIADYRPGTRIVSVVMSESESAEAWDDEEHAGLADFVVLTATRARE